MIYQKYQILCGLHLPQFEYASQLLQIPLLIGWIIGFNGLKEKLLLTNQFISNGIDSLEDFRYGKSLVLFHSADLEKYNPPVYL